MHTDIHRAGTMMRITAGIIDFILLAILIWGIGLGTAELFDTVEKYEAVNGIYDIYGEKFDVNFDITEEEVSAMTEAELEDYYARYNAAIEAMNADEEANLLLWEFGYSLLRVVVSSVLGAHLLLELFVPLLLKNGQTVGKKLFGIALMRKDGVRVTLAPMLVRSILGKCTLEFLLPVLALGLMLFGASGMLVYLVLILAGVQICLLALHPTRSLIHDLIAGTVAVNYTSQQILENPCEE